jgi:hypothetical protein
MGSSDDWRSENIMCTPPVSLRFRRSSAFQGSGISLFGRFFAILAFLAISRKALNPCNSVAGPIFTWGVCGKNPTRNPKSNCSHKRLRSRQGETGESCRCRHVIGLVRIIGPGPGQGRTRINIRRSFHSGFRYRHTCFDFECQRVARLSGSHCNAGCAATARRGKDC